MSAPLDADPAEKVLTFLEVDIEQPSVDFLDGLITAYTRKVPWESAFRIARRASTADTLSCPRWPSIFWCDAIERGGGGTCFESNYAFFRLLRRLNFEGYLTINNMQETIGCHTAIVLWIDGGKWLTDVGLPLFVSLPIDETAATRRESFAHEYQVVPVGPRRFNILRDRHPKPNCFTLVDEPVEDYAYRQATTCDYEPSGYFLDRVIITKVVNGVPWRFNGAERPLHLESFPGGMRVDYPIEDNVVDHLARHFAMDPLTLENAFAAVSSND